MSDLPEGFKRDDDGTPRWNPAPFSRPSYVEPSEAIKLVYGKDQFCCNERVFRGYSTGPCGKPAKHDPDANGNLTKCGHHSAAAKARKKAKQEATYARWEAEAKAKQRAADLNSEAIEIVRKIAAGHNDPRGLCLDWVQRKDKQ